MEAPKTMDWFKKKMIPPEVVTEIFDICDRPCSSDSLIRMKSFIDIYSMKTIDNLSHPYNGFNPFMKSLFNPNIDVAQLFFNSGSDLTKRSSTGGSILTESSANKNFINILQHILSKGGNPNFTRGNQFTPLGRAVLSSNLDAIKMLIHYGANASFCNDCVVLWTWSFDTYRISPGKRQSKDSVDEMFSRGEDILEMLVQAGADLSSASEIMGDYKTPIQHIKRFHSKSKANKLVEMLIKHGADPNVKGTYQP